MNPVQELFNQPISSLKGISQARTQMFKKLDVSTIGDLLYLFPRKYEDWTQLDIINDLTTNQEFTLLACCNNEPRLFRKGRMTALNVDFIDASGKIRVTWFNQPYMADKIQAGKLYLLHGKTSKTRPLQIQNPSITEQELPVEQEGRFDLLRPAALAQTFVRPIYPLTAGIKQGNLRFYVEQALQKMLALDIIDDVLPSSVRKNRKLCTLAFALEKIHFPNTMEEYQLARRRLIFDEFFFAQLGLKYLKAGMLNKEGYIVKLTADQGRKMQNLIAGLEFELTMAQKRVLKEIFQDLKTGKAMHRLLQGDVGSGKTIVAALVLYYLVLNGKQGLFMAPTSILAQQHYRSLEKILAPSGVRLALLTSQTKAKERAAIITALNNGELQILIGTQSILNEALKPQDLGIVITDEQHRFGVEQRVSLLKTGAINPHVLVMSATPIPRSLGLVIYGDMDISIIDELPAGRQPISTYTLTSPHLPRAYELIKRHLDQNEQAYIICPLKIDSDNANEVEAQNHLTSASPKTNDQFAVEPLFAELQKGPFQNYRLGMVHGQLKEKDKQAVMQAFYQKEIDVLVATTVVEVGVDNPNATLMLILNAERFGIAQLHQLRGRIGRGNLASICMLHSDSSQELSRNRLRTVCQNNDGFSLAEADLKLRGAGDFFGTRQHGLPEFRIANLYEDKDILDAAKTEVNQILAADPLLLNPENQSLIEGVQQMFGKVLANIGI